MSDQSWWKRIIDVIDREYDRRVRRSSLVTEYGIKHHGHDHDADHDEHDDAEASVIMNVPRGTRLGAHAAPAPAADEHASSH